MPDPIYLDNAATTPLRPEVREAMLPFLTDLYANPSSVYRPAQQARAAIDRARDATAVCIGATPGELIFTSGATESNNAAIKGVAFARQDVGRHIVTTAIEHHAVLHPVQELVERFGFEATVVPVDRSGIVDPGEVERAIRHDTVLVSVMWANNEIGTIQPIEEIAAMTRARRTVFHVDAVQAALYLPIDLRATPIDLLSLSAHKLYGPKGAGILYLRRGTPWWPLLTGGAQERNRRAGTENVPGIVGMARALQLAVEERVANNEHARALREILIGEIVRRVPNPHLNGDPVQRLPNNVNVSFAGVHGESLLVALDLAGIMASSGSACTSGSLEPSHVLEALGLPASLTRSSLRLTVGRYNSRAQMERVLDVLERAVVRLQGMAPVTGT